MGLILMKRGTCRNISLLNAQKLLETKKIYIIDVRDKEEFFANNIKKSVNIPVANIKRDIKKVVKNKNEKIIVYCSTGVRSVVACQILADMGYKNVYNISTGVKFK